ncbi:MAG: hypothetical protein ABIQ99_15970 [Thermoflexales bacterium]
MTNDKARKELLEAAAAEIDKLLSWEEASETMTLTDIEDKVLAARAAIGLTMARRIVELREERRGAAIPVNTETGKRLHPKGRKKGG